MNSMEFKTLSIYGYAPDQYHEYYLMRSGEIVNGKGGKMVPSFNHSRSRYVKLKSKDGKWKCVCLNKLMREVFAD